MGYSMGLSSGGKLAAGGMAKPTGGGRRHVSLDGLIQWWHACGRVAWPSLPKAGAAMGYAMTLSSGGKLATLGVNGTSLPSA
jgi:hypothetical protein